MKNITSRKFFSLLAIASLSFTACTQNGLQEAENTEENRSNETEISNALKGLTPAEKDGVRMLRGGDEPGDWGDIPPMPIPNGDGEDMKEQIQDGIKGLVIGRTHVYQAGRTFDEQLLFSPMTGLLYPGNVIVGSSIIDGTYTEVMKKEVGAIALSIEGLTPDGSAMPFVENIVNPTLSQYRRIQQSWLSQDMKEIGVNTSYEVTEIQNEKELGIKLGVGFNNADVKAQLNLDYQTSKMKTHVLVKYIQKVYTVSMDLPNDGIILKKADINSFKGTMPVYISDIYYGRTAYALISSNHEYSEVVASLQLNLPEVGDKNTNVNLDISTHYKTVLDNSLVKGVIFGGTAENGGKAIAKGWPGFKEALATPITANTSVPIAVHLRYVDNNQSARTMHTGQYTVRESYFVPESNEVKFTFSPSFIRVSNSNLRAPFYFFGEVSLTDPFTGKKNIIYSKQYGRTALDVFSEDPGEKGTHVAFFPNVLGTEITISRPKGMSMKEFLETEVNMDADLNISASNGNNQQNKLGSVTKQVKIKDLIYSSINGTCYITTATTADRRGRGAGGANFVMNITNNINGLKDLSE